MERRAVADADTVEVVSGVHLTQLTDGERTSIQQFRIEPGATVDEHSHRHEQTGFVYQGELTFIVDGGPVTVRAGEGFTIPGGEPHAAENRGDEPVLGVDVFSPPRADPEWAQ